jgi:hypothetical protein
MQGTAFWKGVKQKKWGNVFIPNSRRMNQWRSSACGASGTADQFDIQYSPQSRPGKDQIARVIARR